MPKVLARTPAWLARSEDGQAGFDLFQRRDIKQQGESRGRRTVVNRGTEVFVAVGNELRWGDLRLLKDKHEFKHTDAEGRGWRVLKSPAAWEIKQLSLSPDGTLLAVLTAHTCHVCLLPPPTHLHARDFSDLRLRSFQVGPTAHVLEQSPLATAVWHPLSKPGVPSLVTITTDACVRLWELDIKNRYSFDEPALAIDLKKLANATTAATDLSASKYGAKSGFSPDTVEMEVAAATFGGVGAEDEHGWSSMTLWLAMTEGDVYALCPFLPSQFRMPATTLPGLSTAVVAKTRAITHDKEATETEKRIADAQTKWLADLDNQEPYYLSGEDEFDIIECYKRPDGVNAIPKLQGPYQLTPEPDFGEVTDIHVVASVVDQSELYDEDFNDDAPEQQGLSAGIVCLATSTGKVHVCLDLDGVEAEWLPARRSRAFNLDDVDDIKELLLFETIDLATATNGIEHCTLTASPINRYELFATTPSGVYGLDFAPWTALLEDELANQTDEGGDFRLDIFLDAASTFVDQPISFQQDPTTASPTTAIALHDAELGHFILSSTTSGPQSAQLDIPSPLSNPYEPELLTLPAPEPREPYQPDAAFYARAPVLATDTNNSHLNLGGRLQFNPTSLQILTDSHRTLSHATNTLALAAADLFRRCERLRSELRDQVLKVSSLASRVDAVTGDDERDFATSIGPSADGEGIVNDARIYGADKIEQRIMNTEAKSEALNQRVEDLRRKMQRLGGKELSAKERAFASEVARLRENIGEPSDSVPALPDAPVEPQALLKLDNSPASRKSRLSLPSHSNDNLSLAARLEALDELQEQLVKQADRAVEQAKEQDVGSAGEKSGVAGKFRRQRLEEVLALMERESALVEAVTLRLKGLGGL